MSDQTRVRLDPAVTPADVAESLRRITGETVHVDEDARTPGIAMFRIGKGSFMRELPAMVLGGNPDLDGEAEVSVYACDPSRTMMRALAEDLGGRYRGSDYDDAWESASPHAPGL